MREVRQLDDGRLHWRAEVGGREQEWDAEITEQIPDTRIAWRSTSGRANAGAVDFHRLDEERSQVSLQLETEPEGVVETIGEKAGVLDRQMQRPGAVPRLHLGAWRRHRRVAREHRSVPAGLTIPAPEGAGDQSPAPFLMLGGLAGPVGGMAESG